MTDRDDVTCSVELLQNDQDDLIWYSGQQRKCKCMDLADVSISSHKTQGRIMSMHMELLMDSR